MHANGSCSSPSPFSSLRKRWASAPHPRVYQAHPLRWRPRQPAYGRGGRSIGEHRPREAAVVTHPRPPADIPRASAPCSARVARLPAQIELPLPTMYRNAARKGWAGASPCFWTTRRSRAWPSSLITGPSSPTPRRPRSVPAPPRLRAHAVFGRVAAVSGACRECVPPERGATTCDVACNLGQHGSSHRTICQVPWPGQRLCAH